MIAVVAILVVAFVAAVWFGFVFWDVLGFACVVGEDEVEECAGDVGAGVAGVEEALDGAFVVGEGAAFEEGLDFGEV